MVWEVGVEVGDVPVLVGDNVGVLEGEDEGQDEEEGETEGCGLALNRLPSRPE